MKVAPSKQVAEISDRVGVRPTALLMIVGCVVIAAGTALVRRAPLVASGITQGPEYVISAVAPAKVEKLHVALGDRVTEGQLIATLKSRTLESERDLLDAEIRHLVRSAEVARLELIRDLNSEQRDALVRLESAASDSDRATAEHQKHAAEARSAQQALEEAKALRAEGLLSEETLRERALAAAMHQSNEQSSNALAAAEAQRVQGMRKDIRGLGTPAGMLDALGELHRAELAMLERRRARIETDLGELQVRAPHAGVLVEMLPLGTEAAVGVSVARVTNSVATDVVAYVPPSSPPTAITETMQYTVVLADGRECEGVTRPRAYGGVERKPDSLVGTTGFDAYGFPVRVALDAKCQLPVGQTVELRLESP
jgi:multidrug efflux pump subunit AcrA (membrane-fusion protein)